ncbi:hypothetical protein [Metabacillus iocasae]|uniref:Uncharacterized protein n=1 Tax=Priestia iocasae TaxID=2291674 RepID=A0ABS2QRS1_9BACI|nr:hypothetical protein [Metabacillus iocasae]MBM7702141.1 hypothetical protein [Metabacillus iocasae]
MQQPKHLFTKISMFVATAMIIIVVVKLKRRKEHEDEFISAS